MQKIYSVFFVIFTLIRLLTGVSVESDIGDYKQTVFKGCDVSHWNGNTDFDTMKKKGMDFVVLRVCSYKPDVDFSKNYKNAVKAGLKVGAYVYMYATTEKGAKAEAQLVIDTMRNRELDYPLYLDIEDQCLKKLSKSQLAKLCKIELDMFKKAGYNAAIYTFLSFSKDYLNMDDFKDYDIWMARWTYYDTTKAYDFKHQSANSPLWKPKCDVWQWSDAGDGHKYGTDSSFLDMNYSYKDYVLEDAINRGKTMNPYSEKCGHNKSTVENRKLATCTEKGYSGDIVCSYCKQTVVKGTYSSKSLHIYGDYVVTKKATKEAEGLKVKTCIDCGYNYTKSIPKTK